MASTSILATSTSQRIDFTIGTTVPVGADLTVQIEDGVFGVNNIPAAEEVARMILRIANKLQERGETWPTALP